MDLDLRHLPQDLLGDVGREPAPDAAPHLATQHEVGDPLLTRQFDQAGDEVAGGVSDDLRPQVRGVIEVLLEIARLVEGQAFHGRRLDHGGDHAGPQRGGQGRTAVQRASALGALVDHDEHPLADRPEPPHALLGDDAFQLLVDRTGDEPQRQLAQGRQVGLGEEAVEGQAGALRRIDVAVADPLAQRVGAHVDQLDLVGLLHEAVREALVDGRADDRGDGVSDRLQVLHVAGADDVDAGVTDELHVLPALLARRTGHVRVGQLVDQGHRGVARDDRRGVHLLDGHAAVLHVQARQDLQALQEGLGARPAVHLDIAHDDVRPPLEATVALLEHAVRLADAGCHAHVEPQAAAPAALLGRHAGEHLVAGRPPLVELVHGSSIAATAWYPTARRDPGSARGR